MSPRHPTAATRFGTSHRPAASLAGGARGVETYTRVTLYLFAPLEGLFYLYAVTAVAQSPDPLPSAVGLGLLAVAAFTQISLVLATMHTGFDRPLAARGTMHPVVVALLAVTVAVVVLALVVLPAAPGPVIGQDARSLTIGVCAAGTLGALAVGYRFKFLATVALAVPAIVLVVRLGAGMTGGSAAFVAIFLYAMVLFWISTVRLSMWVLEVVRELEASRQVAGRLAVAEERLRIARDMHDVVGRALSAVAVKSDLAAALARRGDERAADEMDEVRTLAQESLREVRGVVAGYRAPDLQTEIAGARSILGAAGVRVRVVGAVPALPAAEADVLAWVVREAVTNVMRHSDARECRLTLRHEPVSGAGRSGGIGTDIDDLPPGTTLDVTNDGVPADAAEGPGTGLAGLRERLTAVAGTLETTRDGDRFTLIAHVPTTVEVPA